MIEESERRMIDEEDPVWGWYALVALALAAALHWALLSLGFAPLHFDEAQYWSYGLAPDFGYYSKPPMVAWLIRASTEIFGDTAFGVRAFAPLLHFWIGWMVFLSGRRLFDGRTGFWAALIYATMPGVGVSAGLMTTDPAMMAAWATALYGLIRAIEVEPAADAPEAEKGRLVWWLLVGVSIGLGLLAKYTMIAFLGGALGYALFSRQGSWGHRPTDRFGPLAMLLAALVVFAPNILWNAQHDFASFNHVADNANMGGGPGFKPGKGFEFFFAQAAIIGPLMFAALIWMLVAGRWRLEWQYRLLMWLALPLPIAITAIAFMSRAHPNWAAPAHIAAVIAVTAWLLDRERRSILLASAGVGLAGLGALTVVGGLYAAQHTTLPRAYDPFKKMRHDHAICARALRLAGDAPLVSTDRKLLADCMFMGGFGLERIRIWTPGRPGNHYQIAAPLKAGDEEPMLFVMRAPEASAQGFLGRFREVEILDAGEVRTHADRTEDFVIARVRGFEGY